MAIISADVFRLAAVLQPGDPPLTPASPVFKVARLTGESVNFAPTVTESAELDASGQVKDSILTGAQSTGSVEFELSRNDWFEEFLSGVLRNNWATGTYTNQGTSPATVGVAVGANEIIPGLVRKYYLIEKKFVGATDIYHRFDKSMVDTGAISISPNEPITGSFGISGGELTLATTIISGATYPDPGSKPVFTAPNVNLVSVGAVPYTLCFNALNLEFTSAVRGIECIGTLGFREQALGRFGATISGSAYFVDNDLLQALIDQDRFAVSVDLEDSLGNHYIFDYPVVKMIANSVNAAGTGQDVIADVSMQAIYDANYGYTVKVTRVLV